MTLLVADVETELAARWKRGTLSSDQVQTSINAAIRAYGRLRPLRAYTVIPTVSDVAEYLLPTDVEDVLDVIFPGVSESSILPVMGKRDISDRVIEHIIQDSEHDSDAQWEMRSRMLVLHPTPTSSDDDIEIYYRKGYSRNADGTEWPDIPAFHIDAIAKLAMSQLLSDELGKASQLPDYRSGLISINRSRGIDGLSLTILQLRREAAEIIGVPISASVAFQGSVA